jgi:hypothetical protein
MTKSKKPAPNRLYTLRRFAPRGYVSLGRLRLPRSTSPKVFMALETFGFLYRAIKTFVYIRHPVYLTKP